MRQALIIIDVQNDYFPGGTMELIGMDAAASNCLKLLGFFRSMKAPIFHIQHIATRAAATFFVPDTFGCEIHPSLQPHENEPVVVKHYPNSFRETELHEMLRQASVEKIVICGAMTHMCIDTTARAAFDLGYTCNVIADACATRDLEFNGQSVTAAAVQTAFMAALSMPFAQVLSTEQYLTTG